MTKKLNELKKQQLSKKEKQSHHTLEKTLEQTKIVCNLDDIQRGCLIKVLVKSSSSEALEIFKLSRQQFKEKYMKDYMEKIAYVDLDKHINRIVIRSNTPKDAQFLINNKNTYLNEYEKGLMSQEEESAYFEKISQQRNKKQEKKVRKQQQKEMTKLETTEPKAQESPKKVVETLIPELAPVPASSTDLAPKPTAERPLEMAKKFNFKPMNFVKANTRHVKFDDNQE